jgi:hypothetical protein
MPGNIIQYAKDVYYVHPFSSRISFSRKLTRKINSWSYMWVYEMMLWEEVCLFETLQGGKLIGGGRGRCCLLSLYTFIIGILSSCRCLLISSIPHLLQKGNFDSTLLLLLSRDVVLFLSLFMTPAVSHSFPYRSLSPLNASMLHPSGAVTNWRHTRMHEVA